MASSRIFIQEGIHDVFVQKLAEKAKSWSIGDPFDPSTRHGPQVNNITILFLHSSSFHISI